MAVIDGMAMDVDADIRAPDQATLDLYCDRVACAVGRLSVRVFGMAPDAGLALAHHLGRALQLTNILRDLDEDAAMGRLYLPREALRDAGIISTDPATVLANPMLGVVCDTVVALAREHFRQARAIMAQVAAPRGAGAAHHGRRLSRDPRQAGRPRLCAAARAGAPFRSCASFSSWRAISCDAKFAMNGTVHIIGAGLAGLSAALKLTQRGRSVVVHEATAFAGGRCRSYHDAAVGMTIDNGNHLLLSGNHAALAYLRDIGAADRLVGPAMPNSPSSIWRAASAGRCASTTAGCRGGFSMPSGACPERACSIICRWRGCCAPLPAKRSARSSPATACSISAWSSRFCLRRSTSIRRKARRGSPPPSSARRSLPAAAPAGR